MNWTVPFFANILSLSSYVTWLIVGTFFLFLPLFILALVLMKMDGYIMDIKTILNRLRIQKMNGTDWAWTFGGLVIAAVLAGGIAFYLTILPLGFDLAD